jgi:GGDEF domain-containing protein
MRIFDQTDQHTLERREWELWLLTITMVVIQTAAAALLMYPMAFSRPEPFSVGTMRDIFFSYCGLSVLLIVYLVDRQRVFRQLRRQLNEELNRNILLRQKASLDLLNSLPRFSRFQDRLAMDFRRALSSQQSLSFLIARLKPSGDFASQTESCTAFGDAANALIRRLRGDDSIYVFQPGVFGILLPATSAAEAQRVSNRLGEALADASGVTNRFSFQLQLLNYPGDVMSARELEEAARACLTQSGAEGGPEAV